MKYLLFVSVLCAGGALAQLQPGASPGWTLNTSMSDEFTGGPSYDATKWNWNFGFTEGNHVLCLENDLNNISVQSGYVSLYIRNSESTCYVDGNLVTRDYTCGNLIGISLQQYGYFEVRMRVPSPPAGPVTYQGIAANAWLFGMGVPFNCVWDEIDLAEIDAWDNRHTCNRIWDPNECDSTWVPWPINEMMANESKLGSRCDDPVNSCPGGAHAIADTIINSSWHTYGMVWHPNGIAFYLDGVLIEKTTLGCPANEPMTWILGPAEGSYQFGYGFQSNTSFPYKMDVDYVRVYDLTMDCSSVINTSSFNFATHNNAVKKSITIGSGTNTMPTSGAGSNVALRATDFIQINGDFTVPVGAQLSIEPIGCY